MFQLLFKPIVDLCIMLLKGYIVSMLSSSLVFSDYAKEARLGGQWKDVPVLGHATQDDSVSCGVFCLVVGRSVLNKYCIML